MESTEKTPSGFIPPIVTEASAPKLLLPSVGTHISEGDVAESTVIASFELNPSNAAEIQEALLTNPASTPIATHFSQGEGEDMESPVKELSGLNPQAGTELLSWFGRAVIGKVHESRPSVKIDRSK